LNRPIKASRILQNTRRFSRSSRPRDVEGVMSWFLQKCVQVSNEFFAEHMVIVLLWNEGMRIVGKYIDLDASVDVQAGYFCKRNLDNFAHVRAPKKRGARTLTGGCARRQNE